MVDCVDPAPRSKRRKPPEDDDPKDTTKRSKTSGEEKCTLAKARSEEFLASLKLDKEDFDGDDDGALLPVDGAEDVWYLEDVVSLANTRTENAMKENAVLSKEVIDFWKACIAHAERKHICANGSPGVGKSTTFCYLVRTLLRMGKRVVYLYRSPKKENFYHAWKMDSETQVHPETMSLEEVVNQYEDGDTYYLCDAGKTQDSCDPGDSVKKAIINASAEDDRHWGGREFLKERTGTKSGLLLTFPMMTKTQIFVASDKFPNSNSITKDTLEERHRRFGAIPRHLFSTDGTLLSLLQQTQDTDLGKLTAQKVKRILENAVQLNAKDSDAPGSSIMCITGEQPEYLGTASFVSDRVQEKVAARHMADLWNEIIGAQEPASSRGHLFESYLRSLFARESNKYRCRAAAGKSNIHYRKYPYLELGGCVAIRRTNNMIGDCKNGEDGVIFYSFNESEPLVDFMYKCDNEYYAIQVTIGQTHDCDDSDSCKLDTFLDELDLQTNQELNLVYAVPSGTFGKFATNPVSPKVVEQLAGQCFILHAEIPRPQPSL